MRRRSLKRSQEKIINEEETEPSADVKCTAERVKQAPEKSDMTS
jgi:hypothetical protein